MAGHGRRDHGNAALVAGLVAGRTIAEAAAAAGLGERTARRRTQDPGFRSQIQAAQTELLSRTATALTALSARAVTTLADLLEPPTPAATRYSAARTIVELGVRRQADLELERRLTAIETALNGGVDQ
jgi:hypothetical protein